MLRLKVTLRPIKIGEIRTDYRRSLNLLCKELVKYRLTKNKFLKEEKKHTSQIYFSPLFCKNYEVNERKIIFKDDICWYLTCESYSTILELIQGFHGKNILKIGRAELEVKGIELSILSKQGNLYKNYKKAYYSDDYESNKNEVAVMR